MRLLRNFGTRMVNECRSNHSITGGRNFVSSAIKLSSWESHIKGDSKYLPEEKPFFRTAIQGLKLIGPEFKLWVEEIKEKFRDDAPLIMPGDYDIYWDFDTKENVKKWVLTCDSSYDEGYSTCGLTFNQNKNALFHGNLNPKPPKDGSIKYAGFCNMKIPRFQKSFMRNIYLEWDPYTHVLMKVRGDGRTYAINIHNEGEFDVMWNDIYSYFLYTRGGPYWQIAKIPFSKFLLQSKGSVQDKQSPVGKDRVSSFSISLRDGNYGPFSLEIDYIGVYYDPNHTEEFAYELYQVPKNTL